MFYWTGFLFFDPSPDKMWNNNRALCVNNATLLRWEMCTGENKIEQYIYIILLYILFVFFFLFVSLSHVFRFSLGVPLPACLPADDARLAISRTNPIHARQLQPIRPFYRQIAKVCAKVVFSG